MLALAASTAFWEVLAIWVVLSLAQWVSFTTAIGERQRHAPAHLQARVGITGRAIAIASMTAGATSASLLAHVVELRTLYVGMGIATLLVAVALGPRLLRGPAAMAVPGRRLARERALRDRGQMRAIAQRHRARHHRVTASTADAVTWRRAPVVLRA